MLTRRTFLKTATAALASFVLPAPRRCIDLKQFCGQTCHRNYDLSLPYLLEDWTYASDGIVCVRVRPDSGDRFEREGNVPPFTRLSWNHARLRGWRELPPRPPLLTRDAWCPRCTGTGYTPETITSECPVCDGTGTNWVGPDCHLSHPVRCRACRGTGAVAPAGVPVCGTCDGKGSGTFPATVELDGNYYEFDHYEKARLLGVEYLNDNWQGVPSVPMLKFRFSEGDGLLMALDRTTTEKKLIGVAI